MIFSAVNAVLLRPLPFANADRLMMLWEESPAKGWRQYFVAPANVYDWREQIPAFEDIAGFRGWPAAVTVAGSTSPRVVQSARVTGNFFSVLGIRAELGRSLSEPETWASAEKVAVISHRLWREQFALDPGIIGRTIVIDEQPVQVIGVMPTTFAFPWESIDIWTPFGWKETDRSQQWFRATHLLRAVGRLRPGRSQESTRLQLENVAGRIARENPFGGEDLTAGLTPLGAFMAREIRLPLLVLMAAVTVLVLIACANVGNLLLVQAARQARETSLRLALGAGRFRLVRQSVAESLTLSMIGGAVGLALAWAGTRALIAAQPDGLLPTTDVGLDWTAIAYIVGVTVTSGVLFSLAPTIWAWRREPSALLREGGRAGSASRGTRRWIDAVVVIEVAMAVVLTIAAGLLLRSYIELGQVDPGFDPSQTLAVSFTLPATRYSAPQKSTVFYDELLDRIRHLPGVEQTAGVSRLPLTDVDFTSEMVAEGRAASDNILEVARRLVSPDYFRTMRVRVLEGRAFTDADGRDSIPVILINEALARAYFHGKSPVDQRVAFDRNRAPNSLWRTIVGVVASERQTSLAVDPQIEAFHPLAGSALRSLNLVIRTRGDAAALAPSVRRVMTDMDPAVAIASMEPLLAVRARSVARERFLLSLVLIFATVGLLLAIVGVYAVLSRAVRDRMREMGIRLALGASIPHVQWMVLRHGLWLTTVGLLIGLPASLVGMRTIQALLFRVPVSDYATWAAVIALIVATSVVAAWRPANQASSSDPLAIMRAE